MRVELFNGDDRHAYVCVHDRDDAWKVPVVDVGGFAQDARMLNAMPSLVTRLDATTGTVPAQDDWVLAATYHPGDDRVQTTGAATGAALRYLGVHA